MITWNPHTRRPDGPETAIIAINDEGYFLLAEVYRWDERWNCWMSEAGGLKLRHAVFWWAREEEVLRGLP